MSMLALTMSSAEVDAATACSPIATADDAAATVTQRRSSERAAAATILPAERQAGCPAAASDACDRLTCRRRP